MPGMDGFAVCREMRADPILGDIPILFLTARTKPEDRIMGFHVWADDYLGKPFDLDELTLRVRAILRRTRPKVHETSVQGAAIVPDANGNMDASAAGEKKEFCLNIKGYVLDSKSFELAIPGRDVVRLTPIQFDLLYHLMSHPGEIFSPARLLDEVWDYPSDAGSPDLVRVHIKNLRERVELDPREPTFIETVPGFGYTIRA
jgi:DNA-binding response OmpR family regulator